MRQVSYFQPLKLRFLPQGILGVQQAKLSTKHIILGKIPTYF